MAEAKAPEPPRKPTKIIQVSYGMSVNIGNYESVKFDLTAQVTPDEDWRDVLDSLQRKSARLKEHIQAEHGITNS